MKVSRRARVALVSVLSLGVLAPVTALSSPVASASADDAGSLVEQLSCPPGLTGPTCTDGVPEFVARQLNFESTPAAQVTLGAKAVRSRGLSGVLTNLGGVGLYTISGTGSDGVAYTYETDCNYGSSPSGARCGDLNEPNNLYESDERTTTGGFTVTRTVTNFTDSSTVTVNNAIRLFSSGSITPTAGATRSYGAAFGPEVYTESFTASAGQAVAFRYAAEGGGDEYEYYAFLVDVKTADYDGGTHSVVAHGRGGNQTWKFLNGVIPADGTYRFRLVAGTYDGSGGHVVGGNLYVDPVIWLGNPNSISFGAIADKVRSTTSDETFEISALPTSAGPVTFTVSPATASRCSVGASRRDPSTGRSIATVTLKGAGGSDGTCTVSADSKEFGPFVPAAQVTRSFTVCSTAPTHGGGQSISGTPLQGTRLEAVDGTINSCGDNYMKVYQWQRCAPGACTADSEFEDVGGPIPIWGMDTSGAKARTSLTSRDDGWRYRFKLTVANPRGSFSVYSAATSPVVGFKESGSSSSESTSTTGPSGPVSEPKPFVLPTGDTPRANPGEVVVYEGGAPVVVTSERATVGGIQSVKIGGTSGSGKFEMTIGGDCPTCAVTQENDGKNVLGMEQAAAVRVGGYGFGPGSQVNVFVSSTTRLIGFFKADGDGAFLGSVKVPTDLPRGNHTIQVSGFTADNVIRSVSVGITVNRATPKACRVVRKKGKKPVTVCPKRTTKKVTKKK
jgi:hypothetical protein